MLIAIMGAGGKMGCRLTDNLAKTEHNLLLVESGEKGRDRISERGMTTTPQVEALARAEVVILAVPDRILGKVAHEIVPGLKAGTILITLDPAAAHAGELPTRADISYFVTHPCHPNVFDHFPTEAERDDFFGGVHARQAIVCALMQGPEEHYAVGEGLARQFYAPVTRAHRVTVEQMAILEPTLAETCSIAFLTALREALEVELGVAFSRVPFPFSDGAKLIAEYGARKIFRKDWLKLFEPESVREQVRMIVAGELPPDENKP
jgi:D-apionate oxidoisomerase